MSLPQVTSVTIRDTATGETVTKPYVVDWADPCERGSGSIYWWSEGNMGCDCNRCGFFGDGHPVVCNDRANRYVVLKLTLSDGRVIDDFRELNPHNMVAE